MILKSDGERPIRALKEAVRKYHEGVVMMKVSDQGESQSNDKCEQAVQVVAEFVRVLKEQFEQGSEIQVVRNNPITHWMVRRAAMLLSKYGMGLDGRTPHERRRGHLCGFAVPRRGKTSLRARIWRVSGLGTTGSNEVLVGTHHGVVRAFFPKAG